MPHDQVGVRRRCRVCARGDPGQSAVTVSEYIEPISGSFRASRESGRCRNDPLGPKEGHIMVQNPNRLTLIQQFRLTPTAKTGPPTANDLDGSGPRGSGPSGQSKHACPRLFLPQTLVSNNPRIAKDSWQQVVAHLRGTRDRAPEDTRGTRIR